MKPEAGSETIRLQVLIAHSGYCSRRKAEEYITGGHVSVDGITVTELGSKVRTDAEIVVDGKHLVAERQKHYLLLNKPAGLLCTMSDTHGRPLAVDLFKPDIKERVYNVGRLDMYSSGLILFTNDGNFAAGMSHPSSAIIKKYKVKTDKPVPPFFANDFMKGINDGEDRLRAERVEFLQDTVLVISLREGKNREIRRALAQYDLHARLLHRIAIGPIEIGDLPSGAWRRLSAREVQQLRSLFADGSHSTATSDR